MISKKNFIKVVAVISSVAAIAGTSVALANHSWGNYHWARKANPFALKLGDNLTSTWDPYLSTASSDWNPSTVLDTTIVSGQSNPKNCKPVAGRVEVCNSKYGNNGWLGIAQIWASGNHITQGAVKLNDTYFNTAKYNTSAWKNMVMCQEIAHTFGLDHQDEIFSNVNLGSCMDYTNDPTGTAGTNGTLNNEHPNAHDFAQLELIYAHLDSTNTVSQTTASTGFDTNNRAEWGKSLQQDEHGRDHVFVRALGNGQKLITFVLWAD